MGKFMSFAGTVLKNLVSRPVTINYPAEPAVYPERSRGHIEIDMNDCILCGLCQRSCPSGAITVDRAAGTWSIDRFDCVQCGYCTEKCPKKCLSIVPGYQEPLPDKKADVFEKPKEAAGGTGAASGTVSAAGEAASGGNYPRADLDVCVFCTLCARKCPAEAIAVDREKKTWELDRDACLSCGLCAQSCPKKCITMAD